MLALGIGANSTIFSWVNSVLLDPMPGSARTRELVQFTYRLQGRRDAELLVSRLPGHLRAAKTGDGITGFDDLSVGVMVDRDAERAWAEIVTANFFDVLGAQVALAAASSAGEEIAGAPATVVLSHAYWQRALQSRSQRDRQADEDQFAPLHHHRRGRAGLSSAPCPACRTTCGCRWARSPRSCLAETGSTSAAADG